MKSQTTVEVEKRGLSSRADVLTVHNVSYRYAAGDLVLSNVDMDVKEGEISVLLGPSGCGKTTLLNMMAGFIHPVEGAILLNGHPVRRAGPDRTVVFQSSALFDWMTVEDNILAGLHVSRMTRAEKLERAHSMLTLVGLESCAKSYPSELSGGMHQRTGLARALAPNPAVTLLDEPLGALDALTREQLQEELRDIIAVGGRSAVLITHDIEEAILLGDRIHIMSSRPGRIAATVCPRLEAGRSRVSELFAQEVIRVRKLAMGIFRGSGDAGRETSTDLSEVQRRKPLL